MQKEISCTISHWKTPQKTKRLLKISFWGNSFLFDSHQEESFWCAQLELDGALVLHLQIKIAFLCSVQDFWVSGHFHLPFRLPSCLLKKGEKLLGKTEAWSICSRGSWLPSSTGVAGPAAALPTKTRLQWQTRGSVQWREEIFTF